MSTMFKKMTKPQERCEEIVEQIIKSKSGVFKELNIKTLAIQFRVSSKYLSETFKKYKGANLHEYIWRLKMTKSALFLRENKHLKVYQIAELFGWDRSDAFINAFKRFFGIPPGRFRNLIR
jgi:two-component system response regulator YesN